MSSTQNTASPRAPRVKHQHSKSATQASPNASGKQSQRRQKGNRAQNGSNAAQRQINGTDLPANTLPANAQVQPFTDSAVYSSEDVQKPTAPRSGKKHTQSQPTLDRVFSPTAVPPASLTDSEAPSNNPSATPARAQGAYAGPTFHASPAPSALPIPKFLSKSVPAKTRAGPPTPPPDESSDSASPPTPSPPSPSRAPIPVPARHEDSPLDMLFRADRAEKARNANGSPASVTFSNSPAQSTANGPPHHSKQNSYSSLNVMFPIELDGETKTKHTSPPVASPVALCSVTAPSKIPQVEDASTSKESDAMHDLLSRLSQSQKKGGGPTPRPVEHAPSEPSSRHHTPSPFHDARSSFRSASGPTTPAPGAQEASDFFYGNRNLSPLFKAAKSDATKRNSGLRTEITADSPLMPQGGFAPTQSPPTLDPNLVSRNYLDNVLGGPVSPRRGSAPHIQPFKEAPNNRKARTPQRRSYHPRPDSYPHANANGTANGNPISLPKASTTIPFIPSSVQAKKHLTPTKSSDTTTMSLEQDLKRLLNVKIAGDATGVR